MINNNLESTEKNKTVNQVAHVEEAKKKHRFYKFLGGGGYLVRIKEKKI